MEGEGRPRRAGQKCSLQCLLSSQDSLGPQNLGSLLKVARLRKGHKWPLECQDRICGWQGPGAVALMIFQPLSALGPTSYNICLTISPETALFRTKMKNIGLGFVFLWRPNSSGPLGGAMVSRHRHLEAEQNPELGHWTPGFCSHFYPLGLGV